MPRLTTDNYAIADQFTLLSKLMDIHGENAFKSKSYAIAAYSIEQLPVQLHDLPDEKIFALKGIGESTGRKIIEIMQTGELSSLEEIIKKTPPGVIEMLQIKGLGPKKIATIWKEMEIESIGELLYACQENRLLLFKGFGAKTQQNVQEAIEFFQKNQDRFLYAEVEELILEITSRTKMAFPDELTAVTGECRRQALIIDKAEWLTTIPLQNLSGFLEAAGFDITGSSENGLSFRGAESLVLEFRRTERSAFFRTLFETSCSPEFLLVWQEVHPPPESNPVSEEEIFSTAGIPFIPAPLREKGELIRKAATETLPELIQQADIRAIIHSHSNWSDGSNTIEEMARACVDAGFEYLVISDHSKSAFYAKGLSEERIREQHRHIDELNSRMAPFRIFKSIECDILTDGTLDYADSILASFDLVITSIHSNLKMTEEKAMARLIRAITNPYTTILGHMTGRLLLSRPGYPVDHKTVIDCCAEHQVAIEINAHPRRLDLDWSWIDYALEKGVMLSINPDAHAIAGYQDIRFGVLAAQKGGLTKQSNLSSMSLSAFEAYLTRLKTAKNI